MVNYSLLQLTIVYYSTIVFFIVNQNSIVFSHSTIVFLSKVPYFFPPQYHIFSIANQSSKAINCSKSSIILEYNWFFQFLIFFVICFFFNFVNQSSIQFSVQYHRFFSHSTIVLSINIIVFFHTTIDFSQYIIKVPQF